MSRRSGQNGHIERKGNAFYVRFWMDISGQDKRVHKSVRICPVSGLGKLTKPERERRARDIIAQSGADTEDHFKKVLGANLGVTFRQQAKWWIEYMQTRKRRPIKPKTASEWQAIIDNWLNPNIGEMPLSEVDNLALKQPVSKMAHVGLSAKTINNYIQPVKMIVASVVDEKGNQVYPRTWNHDYIDLPEVKNQHRPVFASEETTAVVANATCHYQMLYALLAGTGLRIGKLLGLPLEHISEDRMTIRIRQSVWDRKVQEVKTRSGVRLVDLHSSLAAMLDAFIGDRKTGFLFCTKSGLPMSDDNVYRRLNPLLKRLRIPKMGFHAFRRFRVTWLRKNRVPEELIRFWIGHADRSMTDRYSMLNADTTLRKAIAEKIGLGFELPSVQSGMDVEQAQKSRKKLGTLPSTLAGPALTPEVVPNVPIAPMKMVSVV